MNRRNSIVHEVLQTPYQSMSYPSNPTSAPSASFRDVPTITHCTSPFGAIEPGRRRAHWLGYRQLPSLGHAMKEPADVVPGIMAIQNTGQVPTTWTGWWHWPGCGKSHGDCRHRWPMAPVTTMAAASRLPPQARKKLKNNLHGAHGARLQ